MLKRPLIVSLLFLLPSIHYAQTDSLSANIDEIDLEDLMNIQVVVASKVKEDIRDAASIVSVLTEEDIRRSGARDLIDALSLLPGINFSTDVQGVVGIGMRGNWGHEGKVLMLIDGQESNELLFSTTYFGNRFDVTQIKRIEVIRGPGSSVYGGYAELGVINIITKSGEDLKGVQASATYGQLSDTYGRGNIGLAAGTKKGDLDVSLKAFYGQGQRSNADYTDIYGNSKSMKGNSALNPFQVNAGIKFKGLSFRLIHENYRNTTLPWFDEVLPTPARLDFQSTLGELKYDFKLSKKIKLTPKLNTVYQKPWFSDESSAFYQMSAQKITGGLHLQYDISDKVNFQSGVEYFDEQGKNLAIVNSPYFFINDDTVGKDVARFNTFSGYGQLVAKTKIVNITAGMKYINHNLFGSAFAPRFGITKSFNKFHFKALYNQAYRAPSIENIAYNSEIKPEITQVFETELGYNIKKNMRITANLFDITISNPIVYYYNEAADFYLYDNFKRTGSRGVEFEYKVSAKKVFLTANYTFYTTAGKNLVDIYEAPSNKNALISFPQHKLAILSGINITKNFSINPSAVIHGQRYAFNSVDSLGVLVEAKIDPTLLFNLNITQRNLFTNGLDVSVGCFDILNQRYIYAQAYKSYVAPMPGTGREFVVRLTYALSKK